MRPGGTDAWRWIGFPALVLGGCRSAEPDAAPIPEPAPAEAPAPPAAIGAARCAACHPDEAAAWTGSHHDLALQEASDATVLGAFDGRTARGMGQSARFLRDGDAFVVETQGFDGVTARYEVRRVLGVDPIQQVLVPFPDGSWQALPWLWDARPGGRGWLALYPDERIGAGDPLHWAGPNQRWNHMCADCHSTGVRKGFDPALGTWTTAWTDEDVACEACHGAGSAHAAWAEGGAVGPDPGLPVDLRDEGTWVMDAARGIARRAPARGDHREVDTCGRCHAVRFPLVEGLPTGARLVDTHRPAVLSEGLYAADGQILGEVYEWGSFLQSAMYAAGVTCSDCHEPHSGRLRGEGNAVCAACHLPKRFDTAAHHRHAAIGCVDCHMPSRTYMVVDDRRDHSIRVPRPDLAVSLGVPEPCTGCHADRDAAWAAGEVAAWFPEGRTGRSHPGEALDAGRRRTPDAPARLEALAASDAPAIVRATAVSLLPANPAPGLAAALGRAARDPDPLVRREAAAAARALPEAEGARVAGPLLADPVLGVRLAAVEAVAGLRPEALGEPEAWARAVAEARALHGRHGDRPEAWTALGDLAAALGDPVEAEASYRRALALDPREVGARVNLADLLRALGRDPEALDLLTEGLELDPTAAGLFHARGLARVRLGDRAGALSDFERAVALDPADPRYAWVLEVARSEEPDPR